MDCTANFSLDAGLHYSRPLYRSDECDLQEENHDDDNNNNNSPDPDNTVSLAQPDTSYYDPTDLCVSELHLVKSNTKFHLVWLQLQ